MTTIESGISLDTSEDLQIMDREALLCCAPRRVKTQRALLVSQAPVFFFHNQQAQTLPELSQGHSYEQIPFGFSA